MPALSLDSRSIGLVVSLLYLLLPLGVWFILRGQDTNERIGKWVGGNLASALFAIVASTSDQNWVTTPVLLLGVMLGFLGFMLRGDALYQHMGKRLPWRRLVLLLLVLMVGFELSRHMGVRARSAFTAAVLAVGSIWLAMVARRVGWHCRSRSAQAMAVAYIVLGLAMTVRLAHLLLAVGEAEALSRSSDAVLLALAGLFTSVFGNIAYIGITLESVHARERAQTSEVDRISQAQRASQAESESLLGLLRERDEMLHLLAHEVRQPLNNASAALQSTRTVAAEVAGDLAPRLMGRLDRAQSVIQQITSILDNTLAATTLLSSDSQLAPVEADLETLVELCLADLAPAARLRILVEHDPGLRTAAFDPGLMRLALRNLLGNALAYSPAGSSVVLRLSEQEEPLAVVFEVSDQGRGIAEAFRERVFERGVRAPQARPVAGLGLGLYIVRRVAELHRGTVAVVPPRPGHPGACLRLTIPQGAPV